MLFYQGYRLLAEPEPFMDELRQRIYHFEGAPPAADAEQKRR